MINARGRKTSEFWVMIAGAALNVICALAAYLLNTPQIAHDAQAVTVLAAVYIGARTLLKGVAVYSGAAIAPSDVPAPASAPFGPPYEKPADLSAKGGA